jgi:hypothetical protein
MARITPQTARLLADEMIKAGRAPVSQRDSLIRTLLARSEASGDAAPETAIGAALMMAQPRTVTPAAPAPMQPGVPFVAPKPTAEMLPTQMAQMAAQPQAQELPVAPQRAARPSRFRQGLDSSLREMSALEERIDQARASGQKVPLPDEARLDALRQRAGILQDYVKAEESAEIPEEVRAALEGRQARLTRREELLAEAKTRSPWEALLAGGAALAQGRRGERGTEALARGLQAGLQEYGRARRAGEEGAEQIAEARDQVVMDRFNMLDKARADAVNMMNSGMKIDKDIAELAGATDANLLRRATMGDVISKTASDAAKAAVGAKYAEAEAQAGIDLTRSAAEENRRRPADRAREMTANQQYTAEQNFIAADEKMREDLEAYKADYEQAKGVKTAMDAEKFAKYKASLNRRESMRRAYLKTFGRPPAGAGPILLPDGTPGSPVAGRRTAISGASSGVPTGGAGWSATKF